MEALRKLWLGPNKLTFVAADGVQARPTVIPRIEIYERSELEELELELEDMAQREVKAERERLGKKMTKDQQHDLGDTLYEIKASNEYARENNHRKWWQGTH